MLPVIQSIDGINVEHVSFSQLNQYMKCGKQYELERIMKAPQVPSTAAVAGKAVHWVTEEYDRHVLQEQS